MPRRPRGTLAVVGSALSATEGSSRLLVRPTIHRLFCLVEVGRVKKHRSPLYAA